jgi:hypothetical protein
LQESAVMTVVNEWSFADVHGAANWVAQFPAGKLRDKAVEPIIFWGQGQDPATIAALLDNLGDATLFSSHGETLASIWLTRDEPAARAWVERSPLADEVKQRVLNRVENK